MPVGYLGIHYAWKKASRIPVYCGHFSWKGWDTYVLEYSMIL